MGGSSGVCELAIVCAAVIAGLIPVVIAMAFAVVVAPLISISALMILSGI